MARREKIITTGVKADTGYRYQGLGQANICQHTTSTIAIRIIFKLQNANLTATIFVLSE
jgi:hypothetical protein